MLICGGGGDSECISVMECGGSGGEDSVVVVVLRSVVCCCVGHQEQRLSFVMPSWCRCVFRRLCTSVSVRVTAV